MRIKRKRRKGVYIRRVVGKNCKYLMRVMGRARCGLKNGEFCSKTRDCGYEEESRTIDRLQEVL